MGGETSAEGYHLGQWVAQIVRVTLIEGALNCTVGAPIFASRGGGGGGSSPSLTPGSANDFSRAICRILCTHKHSDYCLSCNEANSRSGSVNALRAAVSLTLLAAHDTLTTKKNPHCVMTTLADIKPAKFDCSCHRIKYGCPQ